MYEKSKWKIDRNLCLLQSGTLKLRLDAETSKD